ncbi:uncharacterized protein B0I36DRAFT_354027 [Microdochium trichocladiopsis]|uniref:Uncharacterized protein n=1 Tax=Microdochium trichocladiopsis TaxID=1682393 RepID=A0A9P8XWA6_9PEZI|nr:uncharacterized protein B0I36DRAFT_354027 [Microdochium trichocladiopsis]KAH7021363.1 hypothetical protein B0I36DRAFT_354027 [Microdochium trichocladiopsis]
MLVARRQSRTRVKAEINSRVLLPVHTNSSRPIGSKSDQVPKSFRATGTTKACPWDYAKATQPPTTKGSANSKPVTKKDTSRSKRASKSTTTKSSNAAAVLAGPWNSTMRPATVAALVMTVLSVAAALSRTEFMPSSRPGTGQEEWDCDPVDECRDLRGRGVSSSTCELPASDREVPDGKRKSREICSAAKGLVNEGLFHLFDALALLLNLGILGRDDALFDCQLRHSVDVFLVACLDLVFQENDLHDRGAPCTISDLGASQSEIGVRGRVTPWSTVW